MRIEYFQSGPDYEVSVEQINSRDHILLIGKGSTTDLNNWYNNLKNRHGINVTKMSPIYTKSGKECLDLIVLS